jgi:hypothetical protein
MVVIAALVQPWPLVAAAAAIVVEAKLSSAETYISLFLFCLIATSSVLVIEIAMREPRSLHSAALRSDRSSAATLTESRVVCRLLELVGGGLYPVYPHDGDQVPFDLAQHPVRADAQPTVGTADERARRRRIAS